MHNTLARLQNVFGFFTTVATVVAVVIATTSLVMSPLPDVKEGGLRLNNVQVVKGRPHYYSTKKEEYAHVKFDLDVDLSSLFTWNTKQVFVYITATYPSPSSSHQPPSKAIIWDAILAHPLSPTHHNQYTYLQKKPLKPPKSKSKSPSNPPNPSPNTPGILQLSSQRPKYQITDPTGRIASRTNATLELAWNVQPWVGALTWATASPYTSRGSFWQTWRGVRGGRSEDFAFPALQEKRDALNTEKGGEANRGSPA